MAPALFHLLPNNHTLAASIVGVVLKKFNFLTIGCGAIMLLTDMICLRKRPAASAWCLLFTLALLGSVYYLQWILFPAVILAQNTVHLVVFQHLHTRYERISIGQLPVLLLVLLLSQIRLRG